MNLSNQTRATSGARKREDPCLPSAISARAKTKAWLSSLLTLSWVRYLFVLSFTDKQGLCSFSASR